ncbi:hypothetical protein ACK3SF_00970 [Candidatus Nanosalina sp. VS9-1]|uniref:hypothetical protein n=1 Tax=Candidatus Nanosalina sp. VS9-1 TaxID=3388566 RepID=UPI0039DF874F
MSQDHTEYRSRLGKVAIATSHIERQRNDSSDWEILERNFPDQLIADQVHFSNIKQVTYTEGSTYPYIEFELEDVNKKMFFSIGDPYKEIFKELKERLAAYRQAYQ